MQVVIATLLWVVNETKLVQLLPAAHYYEHWLDGAQ